MAKIELNAELREIEQQIESGARQEAATRMNAAQLAYGRRPEYRYLRFLYDATFRLRPDRELLREIMELVGEQPDLMEATALLSELYKRSGDASRAELFANVALKSSSPYARKRAAAVLGVEPPPMSTSRPPPSMRAPVAAAVRPSASAIPAQPPASARSTPPPAPAPPPEPTTAGGISGSVPPASTSQPPADWIDRGRSVDEAGPPATVKGLFGAVVGADAAVESNRPAWLESTVHAGIEDLPPPPPPPSAPHAKLSSVPPPLPGSLPPPLPGSLPPPLPGSLPPRLPGSTPAAASAASGGPASAPPSSPAATPAPIRSSLPPPASLAPSRPSQRLVYSFVPPRDGAAAPSDELGSALPAADVVEGALHAAQVPAAPRVPSFSEVPADSGSAVQSTIPPLPIDAGIIAISLEEIEAAPVRELGGAVAVGEPPPTDLGRAVAWLAGSAVGAEIAAYGPIVPAPPGVQAIESWALATLGQHGASRGFDWSPTREDEALVVAVGALLGEALVRMFGGRWECDPAAPRDPRRFRVVIGDRVVAWPIAQAFLRIRSGANHDLLAFLGRIERLVGRRTARVSA